MWTKVLLRNVFTKSLWDARRSLLGWTIAIVAGLAASVLASAGRAEVFVYPTGNMRFDDGWTLRYRVVPLDGPDLTVVVFGTSDGAFTRMAALAEPVVASLAIGADQ